VIRQTRVLYILIHNQLVLNNGYSWNKIKNTYQALVKFSDNGNITTSAKQLTDGFGNNSPMWVSTTQVGIGVTPEAGLNLHVYGDAKIGSNLTVIGNLVVEGSTTTVIVTGKPT